jgi:hypothetical protein
LLLGGFLVACNDDRPSVFDTPDGGTPDSGLPSRDVSLDLRPDRPTPDVVDLTDVTLEDMPTSDVPCMPTLTATLRFERQGGLAPFRTTYTLTPPLTFRAEHMAMGASTRCETTIPACNTVDMVDVGEVNAALAARDVQAAFAMAAGGMKRVYGVDPRPRDGQVFAISLDGATVAVGEPCRSGGAACLEIPVGLQRLVDVLTALRDQELLRPACMSLRGM